MNEYYTWDVRSVWHKHWPEFMYIGQWPIFHGLVILPYILKTIWWTNAILGYRFYVMQRFISLNVCGSVTHISWSSDFVSYLEDYLMAKCSNGDTGSVWHKHWTETIYVGQWPTFHGTMILPYILKTIWGTNIVTGILDPCDANIYHIKCVWISDLYSGDWT